MTTRLDGSWPWYKDAVIYELHVRTFADGNGDGVGDFAGLLDRLDYLEWLGVTCLWLLPFYPSPLGDDGYDVEDYRGVHPDCGTLDDCARVVEAAHARGMRVIVDLPINHTSDRHPWFRRARTAPPGSPERAFYVWSNTNERYRGVRIIFTDTETSNWAWDPVAGAWYWHRFFSHQPDLNFDNPAVVDEILAVMRFWLDRGVDGFRLDALPYLVEREGTSCESLPETHALIRRFRRLVDEEYAGRVLIAEANQPPADLRAYFGNGDGCHMAFHFPLMPQLFLALAEANGRRIVDVLASTAAIPPSCQWALFLRNHDELTFEQVPAAEAELLRSTFAPDPRMRINGGIRRRLAPLVQNDRRRIELLSGLLLTLPGTPVIYYGDEIGMGENLDLEDRNSVRTPMQWSRHRHAGFSRATTSRLPNPALADPVYGHDVVNVEAQQANPASLLHWMRRMIVLRRRFRVFGRGSMACLDTGTARVLAYLRRIDREVVLCIANFSADTQPVEIDLAAFEGMRPVELLTGRECPVIDRRPYRFTLGPYAFMGLELTGAAGAALPDEAADHRRAAAGAQTTLTSGRAPQG